MHQLVRHLPAVLLVVTIAGPAAATSFFTGVGDLPGGPSSSQAWGVSADGEVVVGVSNDAVAPRAFRWTLSGGMVPLGSLAPGGLSQATGASADGAVIAGTSRSTASGGQNELFRWTQSGGMVGLGVPSGESRASGEAISADGTTIVGDSENADFSAYRWTQSGGFQLLGTLGPFAGEDYSFASSVSGDGAVVIGTSSSPSGEEEAFRWTQSGGMVGLGVLPGGGDFASLASDISLDGSTIVGGSTSSLGFEAYRWTLSGGMQGLGVLPGKDASEASAVSGDGSVIVGLSSIDAPNGRELFIWDETNGMRRLLDVLVGDLGLDLAGWTLDQVTDISADGRTLVGLGTNPGGFFEGWVAFLPEPGTGSLGALTLFGLAWRGRRRTG